MKMMIANMKTYIYAVCFLMAAVSFSNAQEYNYFEQQPPPPNSNTQQSPTGTSQQTQTDYYYQQAPADTSSQHQSTTGSSQQTQTNYYFQQKGGQSAPQNKFPAGTFPSNLIELNANSSTFEGRYMGTFSFLPPGFAMGINGIGSDKDYYSFSLDGTYGNNFSGDLFSFAIGLRGVWGSADMNDDESSSLSAMGFIMKAGYDVREFQLFGLYIDLDLGGEFVGAPSPLCFSDSNGYLDTRFYVDINLMPNKASALTLGYRYIKMEFEEEDYEWSTTDDSAYFGFKFRF